MAWIDRSKVRCRRRLETCSGHGPTVHGYLGEKEMTAEMPVKTKDAELMIGNRRDSLDVTHGLSRHCIQSTPLIAHWALLAVVCAAGWCAGCQKFDVIVSLDEGLREAGMMPSFEVDLVGINDSELDRWRHYPVTDYFTVGDVFRQDADRYTMTFTNDDPGPKELSHKHEIWDVWNRKSARWLIMMAHLPGDHPDLPDQQDVRRLILSLTRKTGWPAWPTTKIDLVVKKSGVVSLTAMKSQ